MMKKVFATIFFIAAISNLQAKNLSASFSFSTFDIPGNIPYIETYLSVIGTSVNLVPSGNNKLKGQIEVQWILKSGDSVVHVDKYNLNSPDISINDSLVPDFVDLQRINVEKGDYHLELSIRDKNSDAKEIKLEQDIHIRFPISDSLSISDIEFIESFSKPVEANKFSKSGYDIIPFINAFYPKEIADLKFYAEIYRSDVFPAEDYLVRYYLTNKETRQILENYAVTLKQNPKPTNVLIGEFSIVDLPSGNYYLIIEVRNKKNQLIGFNHVFFQRSNERNKPLVSANINEIDVTNTFISSELNADTLVDFIACLYPISNSHEVEFGEHQIELKNVHSMQQYFYYFWSQRNANDPESAWKAYKKEVEDVNNAYTSRLKKGYETDRGRVRLEYGPPNAISDGKDDPAAYPYEVWQYYKIKTQTNRKFVFYSTDRSSNDYRLLHSDAIGELQEPNWELKLHERTQQFGIDLDRDKSIDSYGSKTKEDFANPH